MNCENMLKNSKFVAKCLKSAEKPSSIDTEFCSNFFNENN